MIKDNIRYGMKTTLLGIFLILLAIGYFSLPYIDERFTYEMNKAYAGGLLVFGIGFIVAPDKIITFMFGWLQKFLPNQKK